MKEIRIAVIAIWSMVLVSAIPVGFSGASADPFPTYPSIEANIRFWIDVYTKYPTTKGILHDSADLSIVYDTIDLLPPEKHGAKRENEKRIRHAKEKYKRVLKILSENRESHDPEARVIGALFAPDSSRRTFLKAMQNIRCQIGQRDRFEEGLARSRPYLAEIKEIFRSNGMPEDLAYIPHVESSFNPKAHSKTGAAGIWQFTRSTGKKFMKVHRGLDERRDPIRSSRAAAQLLEQNYKILRSWPLAVTAYNHGIAGLLKAKKSKGSEEAIFSEYRSKRFKFASRNFYSEFLAARHVANNHILYFGPTAESLPTTGPTSEEWGDWICFSCPHHNAEFQLIPLLAPSSSQAPLE